MKRYDSYKPSGVSWIGEIPGHWRITQLREFLSLVSEKGHGDKQLLSVTREQGVIIRDVESKESNHNYIPDDLSGYKLVKVGQLAINKMKAWQGSYAVSAYEGIVSPAYYVCDVNFENKDFFSWAIRSKAYVPFFSQMSKGIRVDQWDLSTNALKEIPFFVPSSEEQHKIVGFLSEKTTLIDEQQADIAKEIELLKELKQAEIANVVTHGLNPDVKMKKSEIPWLAEIPRHWQEQRAKYLFIKENRPVREEDEVITCFRDGQVTLRKNRRTEGFTESFKEIGYQGIRVGDLVIHQMDAFAGSTGVSDSEGKSTPVYIVCTPADENIYNPYYAYVIRNMGLNGFIQSLYRGIRERSSNFSYDVFCNQLLPIPPVEEQKAIVEYIKQKTSAIDEMIAKLKSQSKFLTEYKQRLNADVVTGQVKVD